MKLTIKVVPNAKQNKVVEDFVDLTGARILKIKVNQVPEKGKANKALIDILAKYFAVKKNAITIISGENLRSKIVEIGTI